MSFIPDPIMLPMPKVPYFEDSQAHQVAGRATTKTLARLQGEVTDALARLGASSIQFVPGIYDGDRRRYGFQVRFFYGPVPGRIDCAALPLRRETAIKKDRALAQALYLLRMELEAAANAALYKPGSIPLVPYLIGSTGQTVTEALIASQALPPTLGDGVK